MNKLCLKLKNYFSSSVLPYNPKGYKNIQKYLQYHTTIQEKLKNLKIEEDSFIFAFNSLLHSIQDDDFNEFAREVCDKELANSFIDGLQRIKIDDQTLEKVVDDDQEEKIYFTDLNIFVSVNPNISLYEHEVVLSKSEVFPKVTALNQQDFQNMLCLSIGTLIKSKVSLIISGQQYEPDNYHHVRFMAFKDKEDEEQGLLKTLKMLLKFNDKDMYIGNNPTWKIIDIDKTMKKQYPEFF